MNEQDDPLFFLEIQVGWRGKSRLLNLSLPFIRDSQEALAADTQQRIMDFMEQVVQEVMVFGPFQRWQKLHPEEAAALSATRERGGSRE